MKRVLNTIAITSLMLFSSIGMIAFQGPGADKVECFDVIQPRVSYTIKECLDCKTKINYEGVRDEDDEKTYCTITPM